MKTLRRSLRPVSDLLSLARLLRLLWKERPQILHTHMAKAGSLGRLAGLAYNRFGPGRRRGAGATLIHTFHGHVLEGYFSSCTSQTFLSIERWLARHTDCLIAVSPAIRDDLLRKGIGRPHQWRVIPLGLGLDRYARLPLNGTPRTVGLRCGLVGRLAPIKNPLLFLEAASLLRQRDPTISFQATVVGDGPLRQEMERETMRRGLASSIRFTGWQHDLLPIYGKLDLVCLTSWNEGTPLSLIEAMAAGRSVVATQVGGVPDLLEEPSERNREISPGTFRLTPRGVMVRPGDAEGLASALQTLGRQPELRKSLGESARAYALQRFPSQRLLKDISLLYEQLQQEKGKV